MMAKGYGDIGALKGALFVPGLMRDLISTVQFDLEGRTETTVAGIKTIWTGSPNNSKILMRFERKPPEQFYQWVDPYPSLAAPRRRVAIQRARDDNDDNNNNTGASASKSTSKSRSRATKRQDEDLFASIGLTAAPKFNQQSGVLGSFPTTSASTSTPASTTSSGAASRVALSANAAAAALPSSNSGGGWGDDDDLDDLIGDD
mmetsp:Transcript_20074/g.34152  ORF Transcript_20074/g.34152 Transcript_20074/m.34152 type:complete len:203 (+) Transcript_20074:1436-2044(+)